MRIKASLCNRVTGDVYWDRNLSEAVTYAPATGRALQTEEEAIEHLCRRLGTSLVNLTLEGWER
jgi:hypothetical protein